MQRKWKCQKHVIRLNCHVVLSKEKDGATNVINEKKHWKKNYKTVVCVQGVYKKYSKGSGQGFK